MLSKAELQNIRGFLLQSIPAQGRPIAALAMELHVWQATVAAVDRELATLDAEPKKPKKKAEAEPEKKAE